MAHSSESVNGFSRTTLQLAIIHVEGRALEWHTAFVGTTQILRLIDHVGKLPKIAVPNPDFLELWLKVDEEIRQKGSTKDMIFKIPFLISYISSVMTLFEGDVILTVSLLQ
ncbi:hypothetical protein VNO80_08174 [Phaseolus coccineus]|uniref:Fumarylacetoacetase-like C-terminal domain-containing protein n=1 Tax=Phaseolus coccineus TaxID=3886 RepID=A0AAN9NPR7_PHACN